jgi:hypothetical protein
MDIQMKAFRLFCLFAFLLVSGCASQPANFSMYPQLLGPSETVLPDMAILLVGVTGPTAVTYLQFVHSSMPAINSRFPPQSGAVLAIAVPVGLKQISLSTITIAGRPGGYLPSGMSYGYIGVRTPKIDLTKPGLYYIGTLDTGNLKAVSETPIPEQLSAFRQSFRATIGELEPVNFQWPR